MELYFHHSQAKTEVQILMIRRRDIFLSSEMLCRQLVVLKANDDMWSTPWHPSITIYSSILLIKHVLVCVMTEPSGGPIMAEKNCVGCQQKANLCGFMCEFYA